MGNRLAPLPPSSRSHLEDRWFPSRAERSRLEHASSHHSPSLSLPIAMPRSSAENVPLYISRNLTESDTITYVFSLPPPASSTPDSLPEPLGMGALDFVDVEHSDPELCNKELKRMMIASLFVHQRFEGRGFGRDVSSNPAGSARQHARADLFFRLDGQMMDILERLAIEEHGAKSLVVTTRPRDLDGKQTKQMAWCESRSLSLPFSPPFSSTSLADQSRRSLCSDERRGFKEFRDERPWYSMGPGVPELIACFLLKDVTA